MTKMKMIATWTLARALLPAALAIPLLVASEPVAAQQEREACRCVDADGNEIENCTCFRSPRMESFMPLISMRDRQPRLGVSVDARQEASVDLKGALVTDVVEGGPADDAGLREGDIVTSVAGRSLTVPMAARVEEDFDLDQSVPVQRLLAIVGELETGQRIEVQFERDGQIQTTRVDVEELPVPRGLVWRGTGGSSARGLDLDDLRGQLREMEEGLRGLRSDPERFDRERLVAPRAPRAPGGDVRLRLDGMRGWAPGGLGGGPGLTIWGDSSDDGVELVELNPRLGSYFGADEGVLVTDVARSSTLGLQAGDVVLRVGDRDVATPQRFRRVLSSYGVDEDIDFHILRDGAETVVTGRMGR
jgi:hypothetical protein